MLERLDHTLFSALNRGAANGFLDWLMPRITNLHKEWWLSAPVILVCIWFLWRGPRRARVWILCVILAVGISDPFARRVVKELFPRARPCHVISASGQLDEPNTRLVPGEECPGSPSFPSNHAANMAALAVVCWWFTRRRIRWLWFLLPLVIGYSRIYLGYHYPTDVVGGWLIGALIGAGVVATFSGLVIERHNQATSDSHPDEEDETPSEPG